MIEHLTNYPIEVVQTDEPIDNATSEFSFMYHAKYDAGSKVSVYIHDTKFRGTVISCCKIDSCYVIKLAIVESFKLRMVEQVIRIVTSGLTEVEWVSKYGSTFPQ